MWGLDPSRFIFEKWISPHHREVPELVDPGFVGFFIVWICSTWIGRACLSWSRLTASCVSSQPRSRLNAKLLPHFTQTTSTGAPVFESSCGALRDYRARFTTYDIISKAAVVHAVAPSTGKQKSWQSRARWTIATCSSNIMHTLFEYHDFGSESSASSYLEPHELVADLREVLLQRSAPSGKGHECVC